MSNSDPSTSLHIVGEHRNGAIRLRARGELDVATAPLLERAISAAEALQPSTIVLDFQDLAFMDSTGLHALVRAHDRAAEGERIVIVVNGNEGVRKVFRLTRTDHLLREADTLEILAPADGDDVTWSPISLSMADDG